MNTPTSSGLDCRVWNCVEIQRRPSDGYVNGTAMCKANGKHLPHYLANARTTEYLQALSPVVGIPTTGTNGLVQSIQGGSPHLQGTWVHPRLAVDLARWINPAFAVWMDGWFLDAFRQQTAAPSLPAPQPAQPAWAQVVDAYVAQVEADMEQLPLYQRPRSRRFARPIAMHFMQWLLEHQSAILLSLPLSAAQHQQPSADVLAGPELARLLGLVPQTINHWARRNPVGAVRDGWRLIGRGKVHCGPMGLTLPPGRLSWLFEKA